jgi:hypothetical protein
MDMISTRLAIQLCSTSMHPNLKEEAKCTCSGTYSLSPPPLVIKFV